MNLNEIKIGAKLACDAKIAEIDGDVVYIEFSAHKKFRLAAELVELLDAQNAAPKYDPCRRFRKGDKVEYHPKDGRELFEAKRLLAQTLTVVENEHKEFNRVTVEAQNGDTLSVPFYYLKLVTPVEELGPFTCGGSIDECIIYKNGDYYAEFLNSEDAQRACKLLNAEHRKEQK